MRERKYKVVLLLFFILLLSACGGESPERMTLDRLYQADRLLNEEMTDSASVVFRRVMPSDITTDEARAMYNLISTHFDYLNYNKVENDSAIDFSISYFSETDDRSHLIDAWFYKAMTNYDRGNTAVTMEYLKKAEHAARELKDTIKLHKTIEKLSYVNSEQGEYEQTLIYDKENLKLCRAYGNNNWTAFALMNLSYIYKCLGKTDSVIFYEKASVRYLKYVPKHHQALFFANKATNYIYNNPQKAEAIFRNVLKIHPIAISYLGLAVIYANRHEAERADSMFGYAYSIAKEESKINVLKRWATMHEQVGQMDRFKQDMYRIVELQDSLYEVRAKNDILGIQQEYDHRIHLQNERSHNRYIIILICAVSFIVIVVIYVSLLASQKTKLADSRKRIAENQTLIEQYKSRIVELEKTYSMELDVAIAENKKKEIDNLTKQIKILQHHQAEILHRGNVLFDEIKGGGTMSQWVKKDFEAFIEYYRMKNLAFIRSLEDDYDNLSVKNKAFEILLHEQYTQDEVQRIFGIGASTFRTNKTRINAKRKK